MLNPASITLRARRWTATAAATATSTKIGPAVAPDAGRRHCRAERHLHDTGRPQVVDADKPDEMGALTDEGPSDRRQGQPAHVRT